MLDRPLNDPATLITVACIAVTLIAVTVRLRLYGTDSNFGLNTIHPGVRARTIGTERTSGKNRQNRHS